MDHPRPEELYERIVSLCRNPEESVYLYHLVLQAPEFIQNDWCSRLKNTDPHNVISAWFEILLFGFLQERGEILTQSPRETPHLHRRMLAFTPPFLTDRF